MIEWDMIDSDLHTQNRLPILLLLFGIKLIIIPGLRLTRQHKLDLRGSRNPGKRGLNIRDRIYQVAHLLQDFRPMGAGHPAGYPQPQEMVKGRPLKL